MFSDSTSFLSAFDEALSRPFLDEPVKKRWSPFSPRRDSSDSSFDLSYRNSSSSSSSSSNNNISSCFNEYRSPSLSENVVMDEQEEEIVFELETSRFPSREKVRWHEEANSCGTAASQVPALSLDEEPAGSDIELALLEKHDEEIPLLRSPLNEICSSEEDADNNPTCFTFDAVEQISPEFAHILAMAQQKQIYITGNFSQRRFMASAATATFLFLFAVMYLWGSSSSPFGNDGSVDDATGGPPEP